MEGQEVFLWYSPPRTKYKYETGAISKKVCNEEHLQLTSFSEDHNGENQMVRKELGDIGRIVCSAELQNEKPSLILWRESCHPLDRSFDCHALG